MRKNAPIVIGNWKMNGSLESIRSLVTNIKTGVATNTKAKVVLCPPFPYLPMLAAMLKGTKIALGAQDLSTHAAGAYTGEVSADMLRDFECGFVITGHSERRRDNADSDLRVAKKIARAVHAGLTPILCVGESLTEREHGQTETVVMRQLEAVRKENGMAIFAKMVIAYEPVWAIGTGKTATPRAAEEVHAFIRLYVAKHDNTIADNLPILYGGSVAAENAQALFAQANIDGGLIGGASLVATDFITICRAKGG